MKLNGRELSGLARRELLLPRGSGDPIALQVSALPLNFGAIQARLFPLPTPPRVMETDARGAVVRDPGTGRAVMKEDTADASYVKRLDDQMRRHDAMVVWYALKDDASLVFECSSNGLSLETDPEKFADALHAELVAAGFSFGDVKLIEAAALSVSNIDKRLIDKVRDGFLGA